MGVDCSFFVFIHVYYQKYCEILQSYLHVTDIGVICNLLIIPL